MTEETELPSAGWGCPDCGHNHTGKYVPSGQNPTRYDGRCIEDVFGGSCKCLRRRPPARTDAQRLEDVANTAIFLASIDERLELLTERLDDLEDQLNGKKRKVGDVEL